METAVERQRQEEGNILVQPLLQGRPWFGEMEGSRVEIITIIRLRFGHNRTPSNLHRTHLIDQSFSDCDGITHAD